MRVIAENAFQYGFSGEAFDWPEALEEIGARAFYGTALTGMVTLPPYVAFVGAQAFGCTDIEAIVLPGAECSVAENAFQDCAYLRQIVLPWDTDAETLAAFTALFAGENPDAEVARGEKPLGPTAQERARFGGMWYLDTVVRGEAALSAADLAMGFTLELRDDGAALLTTEAPQEGLWSVEGESVLLTMPDAADMVFTETDGCLTAAQDDLTLIFGREPAQPGYIPGAPVAVEGAEAFNGTWECAWAGVSGMLLPAGLYGDSLAEMIGWESLTLEIRETSVRVLDAETAETFRFGEGALRSLSGLTRTLTLLDDGMLACELGEGTLYLRRVSEDTTLPAPTSAPTEEPEATAERAAALPELGARYTCARAEVSGWTVDPTALGGEFAVTFRADGRAALVLAGMELPDLSWRAGANAVVVELPGASRLRFLPEVGGFALEYASGVRLHFTRG